MWILAFLAVVFFSCVAWKHFSDDWDDLPQVMVMAISGVSLLLMILLMAAYRADAYDHLAQRDALQQSYTELRAHPLEMATVGKEIAEWNAWLASAKYWHGTQWRLYWPEAVMDAKPIH